MARTQGIDEALIVNLWERQAFDPGALAAHGLRVVFRGVPSDAGGPDFQDAILSSFAGELLIGDVEFHVRASDWYAHGHARESRYNRVVLHVVWEIDRAVTVREDGTVIPTLALRDAARLAEPAIGGGPARLARHPCVDAFASLPADALSDAVDALGWMRFQARADALAAELESEPADQVAYRALLEGLGHAANRQAFRALADAVPYGWLMTVAPEERGSALLAGAGLAAPSGVQPPAHLAPTTWRLSRLRPGNHPMRRILAVVALLERFRPSLGPALVDAVSRCTRPAQVRNLLLARGPGDAAIGAGRADELAASAILPLIAALEPGLDTSRSLMSRYPSPPATRWTRAALDLVAQAGHTLAVPTALRHQGLHLLYTQYCRREGPADCPLCGRCVNSVSRRSATARPAP